MGIYTQMLYMTVFNENYTMYSPAAKDTFSNKRRPPISLAGCFMSPALSSPISLHAHSCCCLKIRSLFRSFL